MRRLLAATLLLPLLLPAAAAARSGDLDRSFGDRGQLRLQVRGEGVAVSDAVITPEGRFAIWGRTFADQASFATLLSYSRTGRDPRVERTELGAGTSTLVEAGRTLVGDDDFSDTLGLARLDRNLVPGRRTRIQRFDQSGVLLAGHPSGAVTVLLPTGRRSSVVRRVTAGGRLDPRFRPRRLAGAYAAAPAPHGGVVVLSYTGSGGGRVLRLTRTGRRLWGRRIAGLDAGAVVDRRGRLAVTVYRSGDEHRVVRLRSDGRLDRSWGTRGAVRLPFPFTPSSRLRADRRGRLLLPGASGENDTSAAVVRLTARGRLDRRFGRRGVARVPLGTGDAAIALDARAIGSRILVAGQALTGAGIREDFGDPGDVLLARLRG